MPGNVEFAPAHSDARDAWRRKTGSGHLAFTIRARADTRVSGPQLSCRRTNLRIIWRSGSVSSADTVPELPTHSKRALYVRIQLRKEWVVQKSDEAADLGNRLEWSMLNAREMVQHALKKRPRGCVLLFTFQGESPKPSDAGPMRSCDATRAESRSRSTWPWLSVLLLILSCQVLSHSPLAGHPPRQLHRQDARPRLDDTRSLQYRRQLAQTLSCTLSRLHGSHVECADQLLRSDPRHRLSSPRLSALMYR